MRYHGLNHTALLPGSTIFQHDGAPADICNDTRVYLSRKLGSQWISNRGPTNWDARSPDLTPLDFFLWERVKNKVPAQQTISLQHIKTRITGGVRSVDAENLSKV